MCLAQGHNAVTPVRLEPAALRSRVKHSTTEPLRSQCGVGVCCFFMRGNCWLGSFVTFQGSGPELLRNPIFLWFFRGGGGGGGLGVQTLCPPLWIRSWNIALRRHIDRRCLMALLVLLVVRGVEIPYQTCSTRSDLFDQVRYCTCVDSEGGQGVPKIKAFLAILLWILLTKITKLPSQHSILGHHWHNSATPFMVSPSIMLAPHLFQMPFICLFIRLVLKKSGLNYFIYMSKSKYQHFYT